SADGRAICSSPSASLASPRESCIRPRTAPFRGADETTEEQAAQSASKQGDPDERRADRREQQGPQRAREAGPGEAQGFDRSRGPCQRQGPQGAGQAGSGEDQGAGDQVYLLPVRLG